MYLKQFLDNFISVGGDKVKLWVFDLIPSWKIQGFIRRRSNSEQQSKQALQAECNHDFVQKMNSGQTKCLTLFINTFTLLEWNISFSLDAIFIEKYYSTIGEHFSS